MGPGSSPLSADQSFILAIVTLILSFLGTTIPLVLNYLKTREVGRDVAKLDATNTALSSIVAAKVDDLHIQTNNRMDELVASTSALAHSEGVVEGLRTVVRRDP